MGGGLRWQRGGKAMAALLCCVCVGGGPHYGAVGQKLRFGGASTRYDDANYGGGILNNAQERY